MALLSYNKKHMKILLRLLFVVLLCFAVGMGTHYYSAMLPKDIYVEAKKALDKGDYREAELKFADIPGYADVDDIVREIRDEAALFRCIHILEGKQNTDILQVYYSEIYNTEDENILILSYGISGELKDTIIYRAMFKEQNGEYILINSPIESTENSSHMTEVDKETYALMNSIRQENDNVSTASLDRINHLLDNQVVIKVD